MAAVMKGKYFPCARAGKTAVQEKLNKASQVVLNDGNTKTQGHVSSCEHSIYILTPNKTTSFQAKCGQTSAELANATSSPSHSDVKRHEFALIVLSAAAAGM